MRIISIVVAILLIIAAGSSGGGAAERPTALYKKAEGFVAAGEYGKAEGVLRKLITSEPDNAEYHHLLGEVLRNEGRLKEALREYEEAERLGGENAELLKDRGTAQKWLKKSRAAKGSYERALDLNPDDREARDDLDNLAIDRGIRLRGWIGGWETDYTKEAYEGMLSYGGVDQLDLHAGYSYSSQTFYTRDKVYAKGYYFYRPDSYFKASFALKDYDYPVSKTPVPDSNSYDKVPIVELEGSHWFNKRARGTITYEYFRPSFFHDKDSHASNHKVTAEGYFLTPLDYLKARVIFAILRDPDPDTTTIKGRKGAMETNVDYQLSLLLGGGVEYERDRWGAGVIILPNRDLDSSYSYSLFTNVSYKIREDLRGRVDYLYDKFSSQSNFSGETANVYMVSVLYNLNRRIDIGAGLKHIDLPTESESTGSLLLSYKTGFGF
ncbi:MAG: tetratricopeptide repeat protein [Thermodesulfobacteriota bacterium]